MVHLQQLWWQLQLKFYYIMFGILSVMFTSFIIIDPAFAEIRIETDSSGSAVGSLNDGAGGFSASLKGMLDAFKGIDIFFGNLGCYIQGTFMGWDNVDCEIRE